MSWTQFLLIYVLLINIVIGVHIKGHKQFDNQKYLESLQAQQAALEAGVVDLDNTMNGVDQTLSQYDDISGKIKVLENSIFEQQDKVFLLSTEMIPPLNLSTCNCQKLDDNQKVELKTQAELALQKVNNLKQKLESLEGADIEDLRLRQIKRDTKAQIFYLQKIRNALNSNCTSEAILAPSVFQSNMYAPNWILGNQTINDLVGAYIKTSKDYDHITNCPLEAPFYNGERCIQCVQPTGIFNMETKKCEDCGQGTNFNQQKRKCVTNKTIISNIFSHLPWITEEGNFTNTMNVYSQRIEDSSNYLICPQENPFVINGECSKCENINQIYSIDIQKCVIAKEGTEYDPNVHNIIEKQDFQETFPNATNLVSVKKLSDNEDIDNCPEDRPFYDGIACIKCQSPFILFDISSKKCIACEAETIYNPQTRACETRQIIYNITESDKLLGSPEKTVEDYKSELMQRIVSSPQAIVVECQQNNSYSVGDRCVTCPQGQYFLVAANQCGECKNVDTTDKFCLDGVVIIPNWDAISCRMIGQNTDLYKQQTLKLAKQDERNVYNCPVQKPFTDGKICIQCSKNFTLFDIQKKKCVKCPPNYEYDCSIHQCKLSYKPPQFIPNTNADRYIGSDQNSVSKYLDNLQNLANNYPNVQNCSNDKPYPLANGTQCVSCASPGVFNVENSKCQNCPDQKVYDYQSYTCNPCKQNQKYNPQAQTCDQKVYITNPTAQNIVGDSTKKVQQYMDEGKQTLKNNYLAEVCPPQTPYAKGKQCLTCPSQQPLFNTYTLTCTRCQGDAVYLSNQFICGFCQEGKTYNDKERACVCQQGLELNQNQKCVPVCEEGKFFSEQLNQCVQKCDQGQQLNKDLKCIPICEQDKVYSDQFDKCVVECGQGIERNLRTLQCCQKNQSYNQVSKQCVKAQILCPEGQIYSQADQKCVSNIVVTCATGENYNKQTKRCESICEEGQKYNEQTQKCETQCQQGYVYDSQKKECVKKTLVSNLAVTDRWLSSHPTEQLSSFYKSVKQNPQLVCAKETPFWSGSECTSCEKDTYFDVHYKKCKSCPDGTQFNVYTHECRSKQSHITNPNSQNLIYDGYSKGQLDYFYNQNKTQNPSIKDCPVQTPFFNGKKCINCPTDKPYFEFAYRVCAKCPDGSAYNVNKHECLNQSGEAVSLDANLASLAANVFTHHSTELKHKKIHNLKSH